MSQKYKRILIKLSGEALMGDTKFGHDPEIIEKFCVDIKRAYDSNHQVCIVMGGGNICRGAVAEKMGIDRATGDYMGMLATVINAMAIQSVLERMGLPTRVQSAINMTEICEPYIRRRAIHHMERGIIVIFAAGIGSPFFTTDTAATLRAIETGCNVILKGTQVSGIYSADPRIHPDAKRYNKITYDEVLVKNLKVMDMTAISLAKDNKLPIIIFNIHQPGLLNDILQGKGECTFILPSDEDNN